MTVCVIILKGNNIWTELTSNSTYLANDVAKTHH